MNVTGMIWEKNREGNAEQKIEPQNMLKTTTTHSSYITTKTNLVFIFREASN